MALGSPDGSPGKWVDNAIVWLRNTGIQPPREDESLVHHPGDCELSISSTPLQWKDEQGHVWLRTYKQLNIDVNNQPDHITQVEEALIKSGIGWVDLDGTTWLREFLLPRKLKAGMITLPRSTTMKNRVREVAWTPTSPPGP
eukprot:8310199-Heterocapsa_arctica.AAC.1